MLTSLIRYYLCNPGLLSIGGITLIGAVTYVCAVGHIPFSAALVACGIAPGVAATDLPAPLSIYKLIGRMVAIIYNAE